MYLLGLSYRCNDISKLNLPDFDHLLSDMHFSDLLEIETALLKIETDLLEIETDLLEIETTLPEIKIALPEIEIHTRTQFRFPAGRSPFRKKIELYL